MSENLTVSFSKGELASGKMMDSGWKIAELINLQEDVSKSGKDGYVADFRIISPSKFAEVEVRDFYYDKLGMGKFARMCEKISGKEVESDKSYNVSALVGQKIKIFTEVKTNPNNGSPINSVMDYANINDERATVKD